jgi:anti-sigma-K factor RskA
VTPDPHTLVGPYVLDALPPEDRPHFEDHLRRCPECRAEVAGLRATAARLGRAAAEEPSSDLRSRVLSDAARTRQVAPGPSPSLAHGARRHWPVALVAAAAIMVVAAVGGVLVRAERRADRAEDLAAIVADPSAQSVEVSGEGGTMRLVVSRAHGSSVLVADGMAPPPRGTAYALWYREKGRMLPAGRFTPDDDGSVRQRVDVVPTELVGVTIEADEGSDEPTLPMVAQGSV